MIAVEPRQASLRRLRRFGVRPNRELGQNFLIDDNILGVIERAAELDASDVVLEVGGGLGVLSEHLAERVAHVHVVEVDDALRPALDDALARFDNVTLHMTDAVALEYGSLTPAPGKVVANLPYGVAATVILDSLVALPDATRWVAMVQREVGERLAAPPGSKTYGATSVLAQLACHVAIERRVPASVFHPAPRVESALVVLSRTAPPPSPRLVALVHSAFAHRRKALAGSLALAAEAATAKAPPARADKAAPGGAAAPGSALDPRALRDAARDALATLGHPPDARAERLAPADFARLAELLGDERLDALRRR